MQAVSLAHLADHVLIQALKALVQSERLHLALLLQHLAEVDARRLYLPAAFPSMFEYCVRELCFSEDAAYKRIHVARAARRFPALLTAIADGRLHLTGAGLLAPYLATDNAAALIEAASGRTKSDIALMLATRFPQPDVPTTIRVLTPINNSIDAGSKSITPSSCQLAPAQVGMTAALQSGTEGIAQVAPPHTAAMAMAVTIIAPRSAERYALHTTIDASTQAKLQRARELMGHTVPSGDISAILDRALEVLIQKLERDRFAKCDVPRPGRSVASSHTRVIPAAIRRLVWQRDEGRCTFESTDGRRCGTRRQLEFDHVKPLAKGGTTTLENLRLRCRAHNQFEAEREFGAGFMQRKRSATP